MTPIKYKDFSMEYGAVGFYCAWLTDDPEYGTPFVVQSNSDEKAWEELKKLIDSNSCVKCGEFIKEEDANNGTDEAWICDDCHEEAQTIFENLTINE